MAGTVSSSTKSTTTGAGAGVGSTNNTTQDTSKTEAKTGDAFERTTSTSGGKTETQANFQGDATLKAELDDELRQRQRNASIGGPSGVQEVQATATTDPVTPKELIEGSRGTFDLAARELDAGKPEAAAEVLTQGARELRAGIDGAGDPEKDVLDTLASNMEKRAAAYGATHPNEVQQRAGNLHGFAGRNAILIGEGIAENHPEYGELLQQVGRDSQVQASLMYEAAGNTKSQIGRGVSTVYRDISNASFDRDINNTGTINNALFGTRDELETDKKKMNQVFDYIDKKMETEGSTFDEAWHGMFDDNRIADREALPDFATPNMAATFLRDHDTTKGLLSPMVDLSKGIVDGDEGKVDRARGEMVQTLRANDQWDLAGQVLKDYQATAATPEGKSESQTLTDNENGEWWKAKATQFATEDLPVLVLSGVVSGGAGLGARALAGAAGWSARAASAAGVATEIGTFVPTERVLSDVINGKKADWSPSGMARDYALTAGSFGLFKAMGAGWRALRSPRAAPSMADDAARVAEGRTTRIPANERAPENIRALTRENETAQVLAQQGYRVRQNPVVPGAGRSGVKKPDYLVEGHIFDNYAPTSGNARNIAKNIAGKVEAEQARRIVLNLDDSAVSLDALRRQMADWPVDGLEQLLVVRGGQVVNIPLPQLAPIVTPKGYPVQEERGR